MHKRFQAFFLCAALSVFLTACNRQGTSDLSSNPSELKENDSSPEGAPNVQTDGTGSQEAQGSGSNTQNDGNSTEGSKEPLLGPDATDEELLEVLKDKITVVADEDYIEMVTAFMEHTEEHSGKLYQLEGKYAADGGTPYITRTAVDGEKRTAVGMPLKYVTEEPEEGAWVRITGIVNQGEINGEKEAVLETVVLQVLEEQGQEELPANGEEMK